MEDKLYHFECDECGAEYSIQTEMDLVAEFCPFCSEPLDEIDWEVKLAEYEHNDTTVGSQELACSGDSGCEIVDLISG